MARMIYIHTVLILVGEWMKEKREKHDKKQYKLFDMRGKRKKTTVHAKEENGRKRDMGHDYRNER